MVQFCLARFIEQCQSAMSASAPHLAVKEVLAEVVSQPSALVKELGVPVKASMTTLYAGPELTIINFVWGARMAVLPHNHNLWAAIGVYAGREENTFYKRRVSSLEQVGGRNVETGEVLTLGKDAIHSVLNPRQGLTGTVHIYGGDFFKQERKEWDLEPFDERPYDVGNLLRSFDDANGVSEDQG